MNIERFGPANIASFCDGFIGVSSAALSWWHTNRRNDHRPDRSGDSGSAGACDQGRGSYDGHSGHYVLPCVPATSTTLTAQADGLAQGTASARARQGGTVHVNLQLAVASVQTDVPVGVDAPGADSSNGAGTIVLGSKEVEQLPDDPDDLLQELQMLVSSSGGERRAHFA